MRKILDGLEDIEGLVKEAFVKTLKDEQGQFINLTERLIDVMTEFCLLTLQVLSERKNGQLDVKQIDEIISFDLQFRLQQIQNPELLDIVREKARSKYLSETEA